MINSIEKENFVEYRKVDVIDDNLEVMVTMFVMYPTNTPEKEENIGPYRLYVSKNAKPEEEVFPLVLISHGDGGTPLVYRTLAHH